MAGYGMPNDEEGAAFGVYPQLARRRESSNDREASKDVPLQAARGMVAGTLGIPGEVEGMARTGARYLGANVPEAPALPTSDSLRESLPVPPTGPAGRVAGAVGAAVGLPAGGFGLKAAKEAAPAVRRVAAQVVENARAPQPLNRASQGQMGAIVFHGSPHTFEKFDAAKIGTGEGAQTYGHGLYVAENPAVAKSYAEQLGGELRVNGQPLATFERTGDQHVDALIGHMRENNIPDVLRAADSYMRTQELKGTRVPWKDVLAASRKLVTSREGGNVYRADLADEAIPRMLQWDQRMSAQTPVVQRGMERAMADPRLDRETQLALSNYRGGDPWAHNVLTHLHTDDNLRKADVAALLRDEGIAGVKYRDQLSRGPQGERFNTNNFVVFPGNEGLLKILERNGRPLE